MPLYPTQPHTQHMPKALNYLSAQVDRYIRGRGSFEKHLLLVHLKICVLSTQTCGNQTLWTKVESELLYSRVKTLF